MLRALVHYLPPYSPDLNPIELLFSKVKSVVWAMALELSATLDIGSIVLAAFSTVTATDYVTCLLYVCFMLVCSASKMMAFCSVSSFSESMFSS